jgi:hypothetical protein
VGFRLRAELEAPACGGCIGPLVARSCRTRTSATSAPRSLPGIDRTWRGQPKSVAIDPESSRSFEGKAKSLIYINCISAGRASY